MAEKDQVEPVDKAIGLRLRTLRKAAGMSQQELGNVVGVTFQQVQKYERGANRLSCATMLAFAAALGVSRNSILGPEDADLAQADPMAGVLAAMAGGGLQLAEAFQQLPPRLQAPVLELVRGIAAEI